MFWGVSQHAEFIFDVHWGPRRRQMGYPGDTPPVTLCHAAVTLCHAMSHDVTVGLPSVASRS